MIILITLNIQYLPELCGSLREPYAKMPFLRFSQCYNFHLNALRGSYAKTPFLRFSLASKEFCILWKSNCFQTFISISRRLRYLKHRVVCILADAFSYKRQLRNKCRPSGETHTYSRTHNA
ncbi:hypothetical protein OUZ56_011557 [Daphnia magna]|uniref:Uncharacterized protein n=1 Tax=Daphnia magna TaxID=35525 RepID=A0ABQ9Z0H5_9CRUS|nr:hypothetical protein OUZ56_011557 [Daphnia magna]